MPIGNKSPKGRIPKKYQRSDDYRQQYLRWHPGIFKKYYICAYCGKIMRREKMQVDHVIPVDATKTFGLARLFLPDGVNSYKNLVSACPSCNATKSSKRGVWVVRGFLGRYLWPVVWILLIAFLSCFFFVFFFKGITQKDAQAMFYSFFDALGNGAAVFVAQFLRKIKDTFIRTFS